MADLYGTSFIDDRIDALETILLDLVSDMASDDPKPLAVYTRHNVANLTVPSISIGLESSESNAIGVDVTGDNVLHESLISIRIHVGYGDDNFDTRKTSRLIESVANKILANLRDQSSSDLWTTSALLTENNVRFDESDSVGGQVMISILKDTSYTQE